MTGVVCKISDMEEEAKKVVAAGQEALEWTKEKEEKEEEGEGSENGMTWEMVRRGCTVRKVLECATELEEEARKGLRNALKIVFEYDEEINGIPRFGKLCAVRRAVQQVTEHRKQVAMAECRST